jgi:hypothetical protein
LPENPAFIICDSSALLQLLVSGNILSLQKLKSEYGIQPLVTEAVEAELGRVLKYRFPGSAGTFRKALSHRTVALLDESVLAAGGYRSGDSLIDRIGELALQYEVRIHRGEAHTHAAANVLAVPTLSQDIDALFKLVEAGVHIQRPILRAFDILIFCCQSGALSLADCNKARRDLLQVGETIVRCFANCSIEDGLRNFYMRIVDETRETLGAPTPVERSFDDRIYVRPRTVQPA